MTRAYLDGVTSQRLFWLKECLIQDSRDAILDLVELLLDRKDDNSDEMTLALKVLRQNIELADITNLLHDGDYHTAEDKLLNLLEPYRDSEKFKRRLKRIMREDRDRKKKKLPI